MTREYPDDAASRAVDGRRPVTLVCVYNDERVLADCLQRSVDAGLGEAPETELIAVDNRDGRFSSAGAALNHGARAARHAVVAFVHQDVYLHSLVSLERAAALLLSGVADVVGAAGITSRGHLAGRIRDRVIIAGQRATDPIEVDSLDEVLFAVPRSLVLQEPLTEDPDLAWHAYAVEYGLRIARRGGRVAAVDLPLTHNSLSTNLARLDVAHATIARLYPERVPLRTTCGVVGGRKIVLAGPLGAHRWRYRWVRNSLATLHWQRVRTSPPVVLSDIRESIDALLVCAREQEALTIFNVEPRQDQQTPGASAEAVRLRRLDRHIEVAVVNPADVLVDVLAAPERSFLITNLERDQVTALCSAISPAVAGFSQGTGPWCLLGPLAAEHRRAFPGPRARPLTLPAYLRRRSAGKPKSEPGSDDVGTAPRWAGLPDT